MCSRKVRPKPVSGIPLPLAVVTWSHWPLGNVSSNGTVSEVNFELFWIVWHGPCPQGWIVWRISSICFSFWLTCTYFNIDLTYRPHISHVPFMVWWLSNMSANQNIWWKWLPWQPKIHSETLIEYIISFPLYYKCTKLRISYFLEKSGCCWLLLLVAMVAMES